MNTQARLYRAILRGSAAGVKAAIKAGADVNFSGPLGSVYWKVPINVAVLYDSPRVLDILIKAGANVNGSRVSPKSPLYDAAAHSHLSEAFCAMLLAAGAQVNAKDPNGNTPLHFAAWARNAGAVRLLIDFGAKVNAPGPDDTTPLHTTLRSHEYRYGLRETVTALLEAGADPDSRDTLGLTPRDLAEDFDIANPDAEPIKALFK